MAVDVSRIPNNNKFDPVREAILQLQEDIQAEGQIAYDGNITISKSTGSTIEITSGSFSVNQSNDTNIIIGIDDSGYYSTSGGTIDGDVTITGSLTIDTDLTVSGTTTYINTQHLNIGDNIVTLNADLPSDTAPTENAGIEINRGSSTNVDFLWNETSNEWDLQTYSGLRIYKFGTGSNTLTIEAGSTAGDAVLALTPNTTGTGGVIQTTNERPIVFQPYSTTKMVIASGGDVNIYDNLAIGRTGTPQADIHIGNNDGTRRIVLHGANSAANSSELIFGDSTQDAPRYAGMGIRYSSDSNYLTIRSFYDANTSSSVDSEIARFDRTTLESTFQADVTAPTFIGDLTGDVTGNLTGNVTGDLTGNADTATTWENERTVTIGDTGKTVDGSSDVSWSQSEIGTTFQDVVTNGSVVTTGITVNGVTYGSYGSGSTDITGLISGSTFGGLIQGVSTGHLVVGLRENGNTDSFSIISGGGNWTSDDTYDTLIAKFQANGSISFPSGNVDIGSGFLLMNGSTVIDSSKNITAGTISGTAISGTTITATGLGRFDGGVHIDTATNTNQLYISRIGSTANQVVKIGVADTQVIFQYIEDTTSEGNGNFGSYVFLLGGNDGETDVNALTISKESISVAGAINVAGTTFVNSSRDISANSLAVGGSTVIDASRNLDVTSATVKGLLNLTTAGAELQVGGVEVIDASRNITANSLTTDSISGGTIDINGTTAINLQYNGTTQLRIDSSGVDYLGTVWYFVD